MAVKVEKIHAFKVDGEIIVERLDAETRVREKVYIEELDRWAALGKDHEDVPDIQDIAEHIARNHALLEKKVKDAFTGVG